jgi:hypothetical protein
LAAKFKINKSELHAFPKNENLEKEKEPTITSTPQVHHIPEKTHEIIV